MKKKPTRSVSSWSTQKSFKFLNEVSRIFYVILFFRPRNVFSIWSLSHLDIHVYYAFSCKSFIWILDFTMVCDLSPPSLTFDLEGQSLVKIILVHVSDLKIRDKWPDHKRNILDQFVKFYIFKSMNSHLRNLIIWDIIFRIHLLSFKLNIYCTNREYDMFVKILFLEQDLLAFI